jgi:hypothetical protein
MSIDHRRTARVGIHRHQHRGQRARTGQDEQGHPPPYRQQRPGQDRENDGGRGHARPAVDE